MGQIVAGYDLMPESMEIDLDRVIALLPGIMPEGVEVIETKIAPVAFGLMLLVLMLRIVEVVTGRFDDHEADPLEEVQSHVMEAK